VKFPIALVALALISFAGLALAQPLEGTATNGTTGKPAAGAEVTLLSLANGMTEAGHTRTDAQGHFTFSIAGDTGMPHLVRVTHQNVNYFQMVPPGTSNVEVQVYDSARKLDGISVNVQIMRVQSSGGGLQVTELYAVRNGSQPPRTLMDDRTFEVGLPTGATIDEAAARAPNGQPVSTMPSPVAGKQGQYAFNFPLRPGETQFQIAYHMPYSGKAVIQPSLLHDVQHFVAMMPKTMQFTPGNPAQFSPMPDNSTNIQVVTNARAGQNVGFTISGTGVLADENAPDSGGPAQQAQGGTAMGGGPGGGLGKPIDSPDPLSRYRWPLLGVLAVVMVAGGLHVVGRRPPAIAPASAGAASVPSALTSRPQNPQSGDKDPSSSLLEAMKEELFQLEIDRQQGRISEEEYTQAKTALDQTIKRALSRMKG
jgi:hypothetical protein